MHSALLAIHNIVRWLVLLALIVAVVGAWHGYIKQKTYERADRLRGIIATAALDVQLLLGIILYVISPTVQAAMADMGAAMGNRHMRFILVEHPFIMVIAVILVHLGSVLAKRAPDALGKHRRSAIFYSLGLLAVLGGIPWWAPLLRGF